MARLGGAAWAAGPVLLVALWWLEARNAVFPTAILPAPGVVLRAFLDLAESGELAQSLLVSAGRVGAGLAIGGIAGFGIGLALGLSPWVDRRFGLIVELLRQVPVIAMAPLMLLLLGIGEAFAVAVIANAALFPVLIATRDGIRNVARSYRDVARLFGFGPWRTIRRIVLPAALPSIATGFRLAISRSWMMVVVAELFGADSGIGHLIEWAREMFQIDVVLVGVLLTGLIGFLLDLSLRRIERSLTPWRAAVL